MIRIQVPEILAAPTVLDPGSRDGAKSTTTGFPRPSLGREGGWPARRLAGKAVAGAAASNSVGTTQFPVSVYRLSRLGEARTRGLVQASSRAPAAEPETSECAASGRAKAAPDQRLKNRKRCRSSPSRRSEPVLGPRARRLDGARATAVAAARDRRCSASASARRAAGESTGAVASGDVPVSSCIALRPLLVITLLTTLYNR